MSVRGTVRMAGIGLLGALVVVLPEVAGSQAAPGSEGIKAENVGLYSHYWTPSEVSLEPGGSVQIANPTEVPHGIEWVSTPEGHTPTCEPSVPVGNTKAASGPTWSGSCTFASAGVYTFYCTVHGAAMRGRIVVGTPTTTTTSTSTTPTQTSTSTTPTSTSPPSEQTGSGTPAAGSPLLGDRAHAVIVKAAAHGTVVHTSLRLASAGAGAHLEIEASADGVQIGRLERSHLRSGVVSLSLELNARAKRALRRHGHLKVSVKLQLRPARGAVISIVRSITLHV